MRDFDRRQPLIVIHVPKAAGTSSRKFFQAWYGDGFLRHYFNQKKEQMPKKYDLFELHSINNPIVLHGHFNKVRGFGVEDYYPEVKQFITILRDPFELEISKYFFIRKHGIDWNGMPVDDIKEHLIGAKSHMLDYFPREVTFNNYKEIIAKYFIEIGVTKHLRNSMKWIAYKIGMQYEDELFGYHNTTERDQEVPNYLKDIFIENNQLEFDVYNYVFEKFTQQGVPPDAHSATLHSRW